MQSKTSLFNKGIFKSNLVRFWPVALAYFVVSLLTVPISLFTMFNQSRAYYASNTTELKYLLPQTISYSNMNEYAVAMIAAFVAVGLIFGYLYTSKNAFMMAAFPVQRKSLYFTGVVSIAVVLVIPAILNVIVTYIIACVIGAAMKRILIFYFIRTVACLCIFVGIALVSVFLSGNYIGAIANYLLLNFGFSGFLFAMNNVFNVTYYGFTANYQKVSPYCNILNPLSYITDKTGITFDYDDFGQICAAHSFGYGVMAAYVLVAVVLVVLGWFAYKKRRMEVAGDLSAFKIVKVILQIIASVLASVYVSTMVCISIKQYMLLTYGQNFVVLLILVIVSGFITFYVFEMVEKKSFRVFSKALAKRCCIYSLAIAFLLIIVKLDPTGYEKMVPENSELEWAGISSNWAYTYVDTSSASVTDLHKFLIANKQDYKAVVGPMDDNINRSDYVTIKYKYKNGDIVSREYVFYDKDAQHNALEAMATYFNNPQRIKEGLVALNWDKFGVKNAEFYRTELDTAGGEEAYYNYTYDKIFNDNHEADKIYEAFLKDVDQGNYEAYTLFNDDRYVNDVSFTLVGSEQAIRADALFWDYYVDEVDSEYSKNVWINIAITPKTKNIVEALLSTHVIESEDELMTNELIYGNTYDVAKPVG